MPYSTAIKNTMLLNVTGSPNVGLFVGDPSASGAEVSGAGYARKVATLASPSGGERRLDADLSFGPATSGSWTTANYLGFFAGTTLVAWTPLSAPATVTSTQPLLFVAGTTDVRLRITDS